MDEKNEFRPKNLMLLTRLRPAYASILLGSSLPDQLNVLYGFDEDMTVSDDNSLLHDNGQMVYHFQLICFQLRQALACFECPRLSDWQASSQIAALLNAALPQPDSTQPISVP